MKKKITILTFFMISLLSFLLTNFCESKNKEIISFKEKIKTLNTPEKLIKYTSKNFKYCSDKKQFNFTEYWQTPQQLFKNKKGDCEDFAIFNSYVLNQHKYETKILIIEDLDTNEGHAILQFKDKKTVKYIDNFSIKKILPAEYWALYSMYSDGVLVVINKPSEFKHLPVICK